MAEIQSVLEGKDGPRVESVECRVNVEKYMDCAWILLPGNRLSLCFAWESLIKFRLRSVLRMCGPLYGSEGLSENPKQLFKRLRQV